MLVAFLISPTVFAYVANNPELVVAIVIQENPSLRQKLANKVDFGCCLIRLVCVVAT